MVVMERRRAAAGRKRDFSRVEVGRVERGGSSCEEHIWLQLRRIGGQRR